MFRQTFGEIEEKLFFASTAAFEHALEAAEMRLNIVSIREQRRYHEKVLLVAGSSSVSYLAHQPVPESTPRALNVARVRSRWHCW